MVKVRNRISVLRGVAPTTTRARLRFTDVGSGHTTVYILRCDIDMSIMHVQIGIGASHITYEFTTSLLLLLLLSIT